MRFVVQTFLKVRRLEVFLTVLLPFFLIFESAMANGVVYNGGPLDFHDLRSWLAFGRGLFFEVLTYACAKLAKVLWRKKKDKIGAAIVGFVGAWCILVSTGNNLGWVLAGGEFEGVLASMSHVMPAAFMAVYQLGLGLLLPISVGALALVDTSHLVEEALQEAELDNKAMEIAESEMHKTAYLKSQKKQEKAIRSRYDGIAEKRADQYVKKAERGDVSFTVEKKPANPGLRRLPAPAALSSQPDLLLQPPSSSSAYSVEAQTVLFPLSERGQDDPSLIIPQIETQEMPERWFGR